jgi:hypothetical protein
VPPGQPRYDGRDGFSPGRSPRPPWAEQQQVMFTFRVDQTTHTILAQPFDWPPLLIGAFPESFTDFRSCMAFLALEIYTF